MLCESYKITMINIGARIMEKNEIDYTLYLCTDRSLMKGNDLKEVVEQAVLGGCSVIQLREKECSTKNFLNWQKE